MSADESAHADEPLTALLVAGDQALAAGLTPAEAAAVAPPELRAELERGLGWAQLLRRVLPPCGAPDQTEAVPALPLTHLGRFQIRRELGRGSFGIVFLAHDPCLGREVALKVPRPEALVTPELRERFVREARAAASLDHPSVVPVYEAGEVGPICFLASAYCPGVTLAAWLRQRPEPVPVRLAARLVLRLAAAVDYAHQRGIVHRDLKPSNVLLQRQAESGAPLPESAALDAATVELGPPEGDGDLVPKVTDFGLAKLAWEGSATSDPDGEATQSGVILGTPAYMAPEQAGGRNKAVGPAADVYAVGTILYELLVGRPPFRGETVLETLEQVRSHEPVPPRRWRPKLPRDLETICLKCLHKDPNRRYASAAALADDLRCFLAGLPIRARPVRVWERGWKWARRRPTAAALVGVTALALIGGVTGALWHAQREREQERDRANQESVLHREVDDKGAQAQAMQDFVQDHLLAAARPQGYEGGLGKDATIRAVVEAAEPKIAEAFRDRPLVEAAIRDALGRTYWCLGETKAAIKQYERARELRREPLGPDHPDTLAGMNNLAFAYQAAGQLDKALPLFEQVLAKRKHQLGPDHPDTLTSMNNLVRAYRDVDQLDKALPSLKQALAKQKDRLGPDRPGTLTSMNRLAQAYRLVGQLDKALPLFEQVLAKRTDQLGPDHPGTLTSMNSLAQAYRLVGQLDKALPLFEQTLAKRKDRLGPDHPSTLTSMNRLAQAYRAVGQLDKALPLFEQTLAKQKKLGADHPHTLMTMANLAAAYVAAQQPDKGLPLLDDFVAMHRRRLGSGHPTLARILASVGHELLKCGHCTEAETALRESLTIREAKLPDDWSTFNTQSLLGGSLLGQQRYADAESLLLQGYQGMLARAKTIPASAQIRVTEARERLVRLYEAWGKPEQAAHWRAALPKAGETKP